MIAEGGLAGRLRLRARPGAAPSKGEHEDEANVVGRHRPRLRDSLLYAVKVFLSMWVAWALLGLLTTSIIPSGKPVSVPGLTATPISPGWHNLVTAGDRADALWYLRIATGGYSSGDSSAAFFPLYPWSIRLLTMLGLDPLFAAILIAQLSFLGVLTVFHALTTAEYDGRTARRATLYLATFPTAFFFLAPYTEAPFLLCALLSFWFVRSNRWWVGGGWAFLAALTRSAGIVLFAALTVEAWRQYRRDRRHILARSIAAAAPLFGLVLYALYWAVADGNPLEPLEAQKNWQRVLTFPLVTAYHAVMSAWKYQSYWLLDLLVVVVPVTAVLAGARSVRPTYLTYALLSFLLPLVDPFPARPLLSMPRFVAVVFPAMWVLARAAERRGLSDGLVLGFFCGGWVLLGTLFINYYYVF